MITPRQIRAARVLVLLGQVELAKRAGIGIATLRRIEATVDEISGNAQTNVRLRRALEEAGVLFIEQDETHGLGVRLRHRQT